VESSGKGKSLRAVYWHKVGGKSVETEKNSLVFVIEGGRRERLFGYAGKKVVCFRGRKSLR